MGDGGSVPSGRRMRTAKSATGQFRHFLEPATFFQIRHFFKKWRIQIRHHRYEEIPTIVVFEPATFGKWRVSKPATF